MDFRNEMRRDCDPFSRGAADGRFSPDLTPACAQRNAGANRVCRCAGDGVIRGAENASARSGRGQCRCPQKTKSVICEDVQQAINTLPLAMVYSPEQSFEGIKEVCKALEVGTIFDALDKPFCGVCGRGVRR